MPSPIITVVTRAIEKAAKSLLRDFGEVENLQISVKGPGDFVTAADRRAEQILHAELSKARPDYGFIMEEAGSIGLKGSEYRFIIDPLDGTSNFLHGVPHWAISVGVEKNGEMLAGVIYDAARNEMFTAEKGGGAYMNDRRIRVSGRKDLDRSFIGYWYNLPGRFDEKKYMDDMNKLRGVSERVRINGASALDMAWVACGRYDAFVQHDVKSWDVAAGVLLVREAGGKVIGMKNVDDPVYDGGIIAANQLLMPKVRELIGV